MTPPPPRSPSFLPGPGSVSVSFGRLVPHFLRRLFRPFNLVLLLFADFLAKFRRFRRRDAVYEYPDGVPHAVAGLSAVGWGCTGRASPVQILPSNPAQWLGVGLQPGSREEGTAKPNLDKDMIDGTCATVWITQFFGSFDCDFRPFQPAPTSRVPGILNLDSALPDEIGELPRHVMASLFKEV